MSAKRPLGFITYAAHLFLGKPEQQQRNFSTSYEIPHSISSQFVLRALIYRGISQRDGKCYFNLQSY